MSITVNTPEAIEMITSALSAQLVPMMQGSPGIGKSAIMKQIAEDFNMELIDLRLSQCDPTDLMGFPRPDPVTHKTTYCPIDVFPLQGDPLPKDSKGNEREGWILFLDEINSAPLAVQAAAYKLTLDRQVGNFPLHDRVLVACAGNKETDGAIVNRMSTALQSRMVHLELGVDHKAWVDWANNNGLDHRIVSLINFKPELLYTFQPDHNDKTYACPRTWEFASRITKNLKSIEGTHLKLLAGTVSEGVAREFAGFCEIFHELPTIAEIVANPDKVEVPEEPSTLFALTGAIGEHGTTANIDKLMQYVDRMASEFQVLTTRAMLRRNPGLAGTTTLQAWIAKSADAFM